jgi:hypothetical protein
MADDWRLRIRLHRRGAAQKLTERLEASELEHGLETSFHGRVVVSRAGEDVFCYAGSRQQAEHAEMLVRSLAAEHGWHLESELRRWHEAAEAWEDPDTPLPQSDVERAAERATLIQRERRELEARGYPEFEVRVQFGSPHEASEFAQKLKQEGLPCVHRWKYLLIGAADEDSATALADRLRREAGPGSTITAEGTGKVAYDERPPNPFALLGGLAG